MKCSANGLLVARYGAVRGLVGASCHNGTVTSRDLPYLQTIPVAKVSQLGGEAGRALAKSGVKTVADLLMHVPHRYIDRSKRADLMDVPIGEEVTIVVSVRSISTRRVRKKLAIVNAVCTDGVGLLDVVWFNQVFRERQLPPGTVVALSGKVERNRGRLQMKSPTVDVMGSSTDEIDSLTTGRVVPIHPAVAKAKPDVIRRAMDNALRRALPLIDPLPESMLDRLDLMDRSTAFQSIHFPVDMAEAAAARKRLAFDEFFRLEVALALTKNRRTEASVGIAHALDRTLVDRFIEGLPFQPTNAQTRSLDEIFADMTSDDPMHRLLQGEVGSGKTVVAVGSLLLAVAGGFQGAIMAPTEVLAGQHYLAIVELLEEAGLGAAPTGGQANLFDAPPVEVDRPVVVALLTGSAADMTSARDVDREMVLEAVANGEVDILIGTHALIQEGVHFARLGAAVVDEQHRFGVHQRVSLKEKAGDVDPDLLIMTATPIPRTLSMTLYGDLDVSLLDEMPPGRTPVATVHDPEGYTIYDLVRTEVERGRQAFIVCPLVTDSDKVEAASAVTEHARLSAEFSELNVALLHGQMKPAEKGEVMDRMRSGEIDVLVATTVIEVGIDIPNATVMAIEDAHRFGLSQLHQLRGRVGRGAHSATCVLLGEPTTTDGEARIAAMLETTDGFELAEEDLRIRGQGTVFEARQAGAGDLKVANLLRDMDLLIEARREAFAMVGDKLALDNTMGAEVDALLGGQEDWLFVS